YRVEVDGNKCNNCHRMGVSDVPRPEHPGKVFGTSLDFGLRAIAQTQTNKNAHSKVSPIWMAPGAITYDKDNAAAAKAIAECAKQFRSGGELPDSPSCRIRPMSIDPCLLGKWKATDVKYPIFPAGTFAAPGMGTGFTVTFACDGVQTVDYT